MPHPGMTADTAREHRTEGEDLLRSIFEAEFVYYYNFKVRRRTGPPMARPGQLMTGHLKMRKNAPMTLEKFDPQDPLLVEEAAVGAHDIIYLPYRLTSLDITFDTVPRLLKPLLNEQQLPTFFAPGYRFRLINIWRSILPQCEDHPLALCDYSSIDPGDLVPTDRAYPGRQEEIYHLKRNKQQRWYWLPNLNGLTNHFCS
ncbi:hypothetical protein QBC46DRAFT_58392 [Diplogelasinospora grovesii]|uniref:Uncharacterized protein n=1 Tax=Diplogelasinospora grovesii TaxID=303347 RepID=A0AAN6RZ09_9PEZI|nr:hypothetical protein QBC46DRAFT_58392 [Diplogelasinospora grovesii]